MEGEQTWAHKRNEPKELTGLMGKPGWSFETWWGRFKPLSPAGWGCWTVYQVGGEIRDRFFSITAPKGPRAPKSNN